VKFLPELPELIRGFPVRDAAAPGLSRYRIVTGAVCIRSARTGRACEHGVEPVSDGAALTCSPGIRLDPVTPARAESREQDRGCGSNDDPMSAFHAG